MFFVTKQKDLYTSFELIVNLIFNANSTINLSNEVNYASVNNSDVNNNRNTSRNELKTIWPFKISISQHGFEYSCIYNFLNTNSLFWSCLLRLESLNAVFNMPCSSLPVSFFWNENFSNEKITKPYINLLLRLKFDLGLKMG